MPAAVVVPVPLTPQGQLKFLEATLLLFHDTSHQTTKAFSVCQPSECSAERGPGTCGDWDKTAQPSALTPKHMQGHQHLMSLPGSDLDTPPESAVQGLPPWRAKPGEGMSLPSATSWTDSQQVISWYHYVLNMVWDILH